MPEKLNKPRVLGVLAGGDLDLDRLAAWCRSAHIILAADGAADTLRFIGVLPDATIGDFDSISNSTKDLQVELIHISDQNSTDCDKLLAVAAQKGYKEVTLIGAEGDLLDHVLGNFASAARSGLKVRFALRRGVGHLLRGPASMALDLPETTRLSLMPLTVCTGVTLEGTQWPLHNAELDPVGFSSLSNRASGQTAVRLASGVALLFLAHPDLEKPDWD